MRIKTLYFFFLLLIGELITDTLHAQTARWTILPQYTVVTPFGDGMYKVKTGRDVGILDSEGKTIVPITADSITPLIENCALVIVYEEGRSRLKGILHSDRKMIPVNDEWYVGEYPFFSEGKLPVHLKNGKYGYINSNGRVVLAFDYSGIHPFSEGWAAVSKGKNLLTKGVGAVKKGKDKVFYVDENARVMTLQSDIGDIFFGTSFKNGEALVITKDDKYCFINPSGQLVKIDNNVVLIFDEKHALKTNAGEKKESTVPTPIYDGPGTFSLNDQYGYQQEGRIILPPQFKNAQPFSQGYAIASIENKYGVLKLLPDGFQCNSRTGALSTAEAGYESIDYVISVPEGWNDAALELTSNNADGTKTIGNRPGDAEKERVFSFILPKGERTLSLSGENLTVWQTGMNSSQSLTLSNSNDISVSISPSTVKANAKDNAPVAINLTNNTSATVELTVKVTGDRLQTVNRKISLASGQTEKISTYFTSVTEEESRVVTVSTSMMQNTVSKRIKLIPFFVNY